MNLPNRIYPAKILLFGEYTVTDGGSALAVPNSDFHASWSESGDNREEMNAFADFLLQENFSFLHRDKLQKIRNSGFGIKCNIPIGYGLGSSGAVTAVVYDAICESKEINDFNILIDRLSKMEAYFHGKSSGIDPLVSFLSKGVKIKHGNIQSLNYKKYKTGFNLYLFDSGVKRSSQDLIQFFTTNSEKKSYQNEFLNPLNVSVEKAIEEFLKNDPELVHTFKSISELQYEYMQPMIHDKVKELWQDGLKNDNYSVKLCGAGGGGMYLVLANEEKVKTFSENDRFIPL